MKPFKVGDIVQIESATYVDCLELGQVVEVLETWKPGDTLVIQVGDGKTVVYSSQARHLGDLWD